jgi:hypothetical protein
MVRQIKKYLRSRSIGEQIGIALTVQVDPNLLVRFPADVARDFEVLPVNYSGNCLVLATEGCIRNDQVLQLCQRLGVLVQVIRCRIPGFKLLLEDLIHRSQVNRKSDDERNDDGKHTENKKAESRTLPRVLLNLGLLHTEQLPVDLEQQLRQQDVLAAGSAMLDRRVRNLIPESLALRHSLLPLGRFENELLIASDRNLDPSIMEDLQALTKLNPRLLIFDPKKLASAIEQYYRTRRQASTPRHLSVESQLQDFDRRRTAENLVARV